MSNETQLTLETVKTAFFANDAVATGGLAAVQSMMDAGIPLYSNFDFQNGEEIPDGYSLAVQPISVRVPDPENADKKKEQRIGVIVGFVPSLAVFDAAEKLADADEILAGYFMSRISSALRPASGSTTVTETGNLPQTLADFLTRRSSVDMEALGEVLEPLIAYFKKGGVKMSRRLLLDCFKSEAFAEQHFPKMPQDVWRALLEKTAAMLEERGASAAPVRDWLNTRSNTSLAFEKSFALDDLIGAMAEPEDEDGETVQEETGTAAG